MKQDEPDNRVHITMAFDDAETKRITDKQRHLSHGAHEMRQTIVNRWVVISLIACGLLVLSLLPLTGQLFFIMRPFVFFVWSLATLYFGYQYVGVRWSLGDYEPHRRVIHYAIALFMAATVIIVASILLLIGLEVMR